MTTEETNKENQTPEGETGTQPTKEADNTQATENQTPEGEGSPIETAGGSEGEKSPMQEATTEGEADPNATTTDFKAEDFVMPEESQLSEEEWGEYVGAVMDNISNPPEMLKKLAELNAQEQAKKDEVYHRETYDNLRKELNNDMKTSDVYKGFNQTQINNLVKQGIHHLGLTGSDLIKNKFLAVNSELTKALFTAGKKLGEVSGNAQGEVDTKPTALTDEERVAKFFDGPKN